MKAEEFFLAHLTTALEPVEILTQVRFPGSPGRWEWGFQEVCRREGDFALVGAVAMLQLDGGGVCQAARMAMFGVGGTPLRMRRAENMLPGRVVDGKLREEVGAVISEELEPASDIHASAIYRREVGGVLVRRALEAALARAKGDTGA